MKRCTLFAVSALIAVVLAQTAGTSLSAQSETTVDNHLVVHEWGTFTSIAGQQGVSVEWRPLAGASDLPSFVYDSAGAGSGRGLRSGHTCQKCNYEALVRMETPVLYFYTDRETSVSVRVDFPKGKITEWYPSARLVRTTTSDGSIDWGRFTIVPGAEPKLPVEQRESHYYPARETDAAPLRVCGGKTTEFEKFLFYRGVGNFDLPVSVTLDGDKILMNNRGGGTIRSVVLFENRRGKMGYSIHDLQSGQVSVERPELDQSIDALQQDLERTLIRQGLYEKEARAMLKTWRDSWFEEGMRLFYILPRALTDSVLPLSIEPRPSDLVRVLMGRTEIITPEMEAAVALQVTRLADSSAEVRKEALKTIRAYGRFSEPVLRRIREKTDDQETRSQIDKLLKKV